MPTAASTKPGSIPLRPLAAGDIFTGIVPTAVRCWRPVLVLAGVVAVAGGLLAYPLLDRGFTRLDALQTLGADARLEQVLSAVGGSFGWFAGMFVIAAAAAQLSVGLLAPFMHAAVVGQRIGLGEAWQRARPQIGRLVLLALVTGVLPLIGYLLCYLPGLALTTAWLFAVPALVIERCSIGQALSRSWALVHGQFWRVLGIWLVVMLVAGFIANALTSPLLVPLMSFDPPADQTVFPDFPAPAVAVAQVILGAVLWPLLAAAAMLLYVDARIRREGYDVALAQAAGR